MLISMMAAIVIVSIIISASLFLNSAINESGEMLETITSTQKHLIEAVGEFDQIHSSGDHPGGNVAATLSQVIEAYRRLDMPLESGELLIGERRANNVALLFSVGQHSYSPDKAKDRYRLGASEHYVPIDDEGILPIRNALAGDSGWVICKDLRGEWILAAYTPVTIAGHLFGLMVKIDLAEIVTPSAWAGTVSLGVSFCLIVFGASYFLRLINPLTEELELRIEDLAESEEKFSTLFETANDAIFTIENGVFQDCNQGILRMFGCEKEHIIGKTPIDFSPLFQADGRPSVEKAQEKISNALAGKPQLFEWQHIRCDDTPFDTEISINRFSARGHDFLLAVVRDISERKRMTQELLLAKKKAEEANKAKSQFLNIVSHELRTPLTVILGNLPYAVHEMETLIEENKQGMTTEVDLEDVRDSLMDSIDDGKILLSMVSDLLDLSRVEAQKLTLDIKPMDSADLCNNVAESIRPLVENKGIVLNVDASELEVEGDKIRLKQVMYNLLTNAVKFTSEGCITIEVAPVRDMAQFSVKDTGCGIDDENLTTIFKPFEQADNSVTRIAGGSGLGLAISKRLVEMHGGKMEVESVVGQGSLFRFTVPLSKRNEHE